MPFTDVSSKNAEALEDAMVKYIDVTSHLALISKFRQMLQENYLAGGLSVGSRFGWVEAIILPHV